MKKMIGILPLPPIPLPPEVQIWIRGQKKMTLFCQQKRRKEGRRKGGKKEEGKKGGRRGRRKKGKKGGKKGM